MGQITDAVNGKITDWTIYCLEAPGNAHGDTDSLKISFGHSTAANLALSGTLTDASCEGSFHSASAVWSLGLRRSGSCGTPITVAGAHTQPLGLFSDKYIYLTTTEEVVEVAQTAGAYTETSRD